MRSVIQRASTAGSSWSFGIRALRSRECGLYEASDLLLGDNLCSKSVTVVYVDVSRPHKRSRRLKDLKDMAECDPESEDIFEQNLYNDYYPKRPSELDGLCLFDFLSNYDFYGKDKSGKRKYMKPRLVDHKVKRRTRGKTSTTL